MKTKILIMALTLAAFGAEKNRGGAGTLTEGGSTNGMLAGHGTNGVRGHGTNGIMSDGGTIGRTSRSGGTQG